MKKLFSILAMLLVFVYSCKKNNNKNNNNTIDNYDYPTGALPSKISYIQNLPNIEDIDTSNIAVFQRPGGFTLTGLGYEIDFMPSLSELPLFRLPWPTQQIGNSCVGWALANVMNYYFRIIEKNNTYGESGMMDKVFSPYYLYNQRPNNSTDAGASFGDLIPILESQGCSKWADMISPGSDPYNAQPSAIARANATSYKILGAYRIFKLRFVSPASISYLKTLLRHNYPMPFSVKVDEGFVSGGANTTSFSRKPDGRYVWKSKYGEEKKELHAMVLCGYDDEIHAFKVLNSWGQQWGNDGYIWVDYDFFFKQLRGYSDFSLGSILGYDLFMITPQRVDGTVVTNLPSNVTATSATCQGIVSITGSATISEKGICYSLYKNPTTGSSELGNISVSNGSGNGNICKHNRFAGK